MSLATSIAGPNWQFSYSNIITLGRLLLGAPMTIAAYSFEWQMTAFVLFVAWALTDIVDGWLARLEKRTTDWGAFWDPLADKGLSDLMLIFLTCAHPVGLWLAVPAGVVVGYDAYMLEKRRKRPRMGASHVAKAKTFVLFFGIGAVLGVEAGINPIISWWPIALVWLASLMCTWSWWIYSRQ